MNSDEEEIGGREVGAVQIDITGDRRRGNELITQARSLLGNLKMRMGFNQLRQGQDVLELEEQKYTTTLYDLLFSGELVGENIPIDYAKKTAIEATVNSSIAVSSIKIGGTSADIDKIAIDVQVKYRETGKKSGKVCRGFIVQVFSDYLDAVDDVHDLTVSLQAILPSNDKLGETHTDNVGWPITPFEGGMVIADKTGNEIPFSGFNANGLNYINNYQHFDLDPGVNDLSPEHITAFNVHEFYTNTETLNGTLVGTVVHDGYQYLNYGFNYNVDRTIPGFIGNPLTRKDHRCFVIGTGFTIKDGKYLLDYASKDAGINALFMLPLKEDQLIFNYSSAVSAFSNFSNSNDTTETDAFGNVLHDVGYFTEDMNPGSFGIPCIVKDGTYHIHAEYRDIYQTATRLQKIKIYLLTDEGMMTKEYKDFDITQDIQIKVGAYNTDPFGELVKIKSV